MNDLTFKIVGYVPLCIVGSIIFALSSMSNHLEFAHIKSAMSDHAWHALVFFSFSICAAFGAYRRTGRLVPNAALEALIVTLLFALLDEFHQSFVPHRHASLGDVLADVVGGIVGVGIFVLAVRAQKNPRNGGRFWG